MPIGILKCRASAGELIHFLLDYPALLYHSIFEGKRRSTAFEKCRFYIHEEFISQRDMFLHISPNTIKTIFVGVNFNAAYLQWVKFWRDVYNPNVEIRQMNFVTCSYELFDDTELKDKTVRM